MVSIENRVKYHQRIKESPKLTAFNNLLLGDSFIPSSKQILNESDKIYFGLVHAIHSNDKAKFEIHYFKKKKSNPSRELPSPFVNDDFLIFCLIIGIIKFEYEKSWIKNIISIRNRTPITITFENLLNEDYYSRSNLPEIVLVFFQFFDQTLITNDLLNFSYERISKNVTLFENKSDFQIICAIRAYDMIIYLKELSDLEEVKLLKSFNIRFLQRVKVLTWIVQSSIFLICLYFLAGYLSGSENAEKFFNKYRNLFTLLGALGLTLLGNYIPFIKKKSREIILVICGYPKELIKQIKQSNNRMEK